MKNDVRQNTTILLTEVFSVADSIRKTISDLTDMVSPDIFLVFQYTSALKLVFIV